MKLTWAIVFILGVVVVTAEERFKRQAGYQFPGPRSGSASAPSYAGQQAAYVQQQAPARYVVEEDDEEEIYQVPRRQFQAQPVQQYTPTQQQRTPQSAPAPSGGLIQAPAPPPRSYSTPRKKAAASSGSRYVSNAPQQQLNGAAEEEEEEQGPDPLTLLLQDSKFNCASKQDGYYADDSVDCQVFHYCVAGARHSWMCPAGTVFHQVHLNCVPANQDICAQSQKFHFVNEYLYKPADYEGPNNTARYYQRYYPDGYVIGDQFQSPPEESSRPRQRVQEQVFNAAPVAQYPEGAPRQVSRAPAPQPQPIAYNPQPQNPVSSFNAAPAARTSRPSRPAFQAVQQLPQSYRSAAAAAAPQSQPALTQAQPQGNLYLVQANPRRPSASPQRSGYTSRQNVQAAAVAPYSGFTNDASGVQYDEDY